MFRSTTIFREYTKHAATPPRLVYIQLWSNNSDFSEDIVTP